MGLQKIPTIQHVKKREKLLIIRLTTKQGRIKIPLKPHKLFFKYLNEGWKIKPGIKLKLNDEERKVKILFTFEKEVETPEPTGKYLTIDYNANNVTIGTNEFLIQIKTDLGRTTRLYTNIRRKIQKTHLVGWKRKRLSRKGRKLLKKFGVRKRNRRVDLQRKLVKRLFELSKELGVTVVLEGVPKNFNQLVTRRKGRSKRALRDVLHNIGMNGFQKFVVDGGFEFGVPVVFVRPAYSSRVCPRCGAFNVKSDDDALRRRVFECPVCGFSLDRDFVAVLNLMGVFPFTPKANEPLTEDSVSPAMLVVEANLLHDRNSLVVVSQGLSRKNV